MKPKLVMLVAVGIAATVCFGSLAGTAEQKRSIQAASTGVGPGEFAAAVQF